LLKTVRVSLKLLGVKKIEQFNRFGACFDYGTDQVKLELNQRFFAYFE